MTACFYNFFYLHKIIFYVKEIEKYCEIRMFSKWDDDNGQKISINLSNQNIYFKDSLMAISSFKNRVDVLDYMSKLKWSVVLISAYGGVQSFHFKKEFDKYDFTIDSN